MPRSLLRIFPLFLVPSLVVACGDGDSGGSTDGKKTETTIADVTTTTQPATFCGVATTYATELVDALDNGANQTVEDSPLNTREFWQRYKELQTQMRDLAPAEISADAELAYESAMAAYDYMEEFEFSMKVASEDPSFANDERFTGEKYMKAGAAFQGYIDENCDIQLTK